jgi:hypothetical protein
MPVDLPKGLTEKARQEAAEFRENDQKRGESGRDTERSSEKGSEKGSSEKGSQDGKKEGKMQEYEFTVWEDRILEVVMEAMRMAGLALAVRAIATFCLGALLHVLTGPPPPPKLPAWVRICMSCQVDNAVAASFSFEAYGMCFMLTHSSMGFRDSQLSQHEGRKGFISASCLGDSGA